LAEATVLKFFKHSTLFRDTSQLAVGQGMKLIIQATYFVLIARCLGPGTYGAFTAVVALAAILSPFSGIGSNNLFIKNVRSGKRTSSLCWGNGLIATVCSGFAFSGLVLLIEYVFHLRTALWVVIAVCISDLVLLRITELAVFGFAAVDRMKETVVQNVGGSLLRLIAIGALSLLHRPVSLELWAGAYLLASVLGTTYSIYRAYQILGAPSFDLGCLREDAADGVYFSIGASAATIYNDVDKVMLGKVSFVAVGIYAAAYRIIDVSMTPIRSLISAAYPRFFEKGLQGMKSTYPYALTQIGRATLYSVVLVPVLWIAAPLLPRILGEHYANTISALRWLALLPVLRGVHSFLADSLSGAGFQGFRSAIQVMVALVNIGLNLVILPRYGWLGAAWTSLASDGLLVVSFWVAVRYKVRIATPARLSQVIV
jgi:O-antigen/teichoic acid export membrane protein